MTESPSNETFKVVFLPDNVEIRAKKGAILQETAISAGVHVNASCGGKGVCGTCKVKIEQGTVESSENSMIPMPDYNKGIRLACQSRIISDLVVSIPVESRLDKAIQARERGKLTGASLSQWRFKPVLNKYYLELTPPTSQDNSSDLFRLMGGLEQTYNLKNLPASIDVICKLSRVIREKDWKVTVTTLLEPARPRTKDKNSAFIVNIEAGDTR